MARKFTDIDILDSLVKQFGDNADASAWSNIRAKLDEVQKPVAQQPLNAIALCKDMLEAFEKDYHSVENINVFRMRFKSVLAQQQSNKQSTPAQQPQQYICTRSNGGTAYVHCGYYTARKDTCAATGECGHKRPAVR